MFACIFSSFSRSLSFLSLSLPPTLYDYPLLHYPHPNLHPHIIPSSLFVYHPLSLSIYSLGPCVPSFLCNSSDSSFYHFLSLLFNTQECSHLPHSASHAACFKSRHLSQHHHAISLLCEEELLLRWMRAWVRTERCMVKVW